MDDLDGFRREAERALLGLPGSWVSLADTHGQQLVNTFVSVGTPLPPLGANSLRDEARAFETGQAQVSDVTIGSVAKSPIIVVGIPVFQAGAPAYYLMIAAHAGVFQDLLNQKHLPGGWVAAVTDRRGNFITRSRDHEDWVGKPASGFASSEGQRLAYESTVSPLSGWAVGVGAEKTILGAPIQRTLFIAAFVGLGVTVSSMLLAAWAAREDHGPDQGPRSQRGGSAEQQPGVFSRHGGA